MKTDCFDAVVNFSPVSIEKPLDALLVVQRKKISASFYFYEQAPKGKPGLFFVRIHCHQPLSLKWKDKFDVQARGNKQLLGEGHVLNPFSEKISRSKIKKRISFLKHLQGDEREMLFALVQERGLQGLKEREIIDFSSLSKRSLLRLIQELEAEGKIRILSFSPLFLLSQEGLDFLCQKICSFIAQFHNKYPEETGTSLERIKRRFNFHPRILSLALKNLMRQGQVQEFGDRLSLADFKTTLIPEEESILRELEDMCFKGEFRSLSLEDLRKRFRLSSQRLHKMISLLIEREKIVQGKDGLILHSRWLDEIIGKIRKSGQKELTVADFKQMTGLTRKYAIPLLELLDQMGVTRRKGPLREIL